MIRVFLRGFAIVFLTALNVTQVSRGHYLGALLVGFGISFVWYGNSQSANDRRSRTAQVTYACGAACGTICGMWVGLR